MSKFKWWRKWRGGYWIYWSPRWIKVSKKRYDKMYRYLERTGCSDWALECYEEN